MRKLKFHEKKLLKKTNFFEWKDAAHNREGDLIRRYLLKERTDVIQYNRLAGSIYIIITELQKLPPDDPFRIERTKQILDKLFRLGLIESNHSLADAERLNPATFCRRRLPVVLVRLNMANNMKEAVRYVEHGHVRVGPNVVRDPAFLVTRTYEDYITWVDNSKIRQTILKYNNNLDDFDILAN
eukprot:TRINITY_DN10844_c0_g1_i1.p1 TRINITY_DN10844_c0_g1~~TRINITY_DN10844_c0_g1_i1.p1  ORF type:complete len:184 (-),score=33.74 TRINITY_DN10844_c0_g1_i1:40-591(-)